MIDGLTEALSRTVTAADLVAKTDATLSVTVDAWGDVAITADDSSGVHVRVLQHGRVGRAGGLEADAPAVVEAALRSARGGPALELMLPVASPLAPVVTEAPAAASAGSDALLALARTLADRLRRPGRRLDVWAERSAGEVRIANTRGVSAAYRTTVAGAGVSVRVPGTDFDAPFRAWVSGSDLPDLPEIEALAAEIDRWTGLPAVEEAPRGSRHRAWFHPRAVRTLFQPLLHRLTGETWVDRRRDPPALDPRLTLIDDPLAPGRPGSRPISDDGVVTRRLLLVDRGRPVQGIVDLEAGARFRVPATGHGVRRMLGAPRAGFSNLIVLPGDVPTGSLAALVGEGLVVLALDWGPAPNPAPGLFRARAPWTFLVRGGEIVGRLEGVVLAGNADELLAEVVAVGADAPWDGAASLPSLVVEGVLLEER